MQFISDFAHKLEHKKMTENSVKAEGSSFASEQRAHPNSHMLPHSPCNCMHVLVMPAPWRLVLFNRSLKMLSWTCVEACEASGETFLQLSLRTAH